MSFSTMGDAGAGFLAAAANNMRRGFERLHGQQGNPTADVLRVTVSGENPAAGIAGTETQVAGLSGLDVVVGDFTKDVADAMGEEWDAGRKVFQFVDVEVLKTDFISFDSARWAPTSIDYRSDWGVCIVVARREE